MLTPRQRHGPPLTALQTTSKPQEQKSSLFLVGAGPAVSGTKKLRTHTKLIFGVKNGGLHDKKATQAPQNPAALGLLAAES